jgi:multidrug efflux pump subunit AcrA (membrane-fusion protein)
MANRGHSKSAWLIFCIIVVAVAVGIYFIAWLPRQQRQHRIEQDARERTQQRPRVNVVRVHRAPPVSELTLPGTSLAYTEASIYARASGYVSRRFVDIGDRVHTGQLLAIIDAPDLDKQVAQGRSTLLQSQSDLIQLQAQLHLQSVNWDRFKVLVTKGVFSRQQGDQQEANFHVAEANAQAAQSTIQANRDNLERLTVLQGYERVTAPFNGLITARNVDVGTLISGTGSGLGGPGGPSAAPLTGGAQGGQMFGIADITQLRVFVSAPEAYTPAIRVGQNVELTFQELGSEKFEGRVSRTSSSIDQTTRTLLVEVHVANPRYRLLPGMFVIAKFIDTQPVRPIAIPGEAIVIRNGQQMVAIVKDNEVQFRPITIGRDYGDRTEVLTGLNEGDVIATTVTDEVRDGVEIEPRFPKQQDQKQ